MYKVIVIGDVACGKTSLINRFCYQVFDTKYKSTIGVDFEVEKFDIIGVPFNLQIWDTAGQERFKSIAQSYYRCAHVVMIVFDLTNIFSLNNTKTWLAEALAASGNSNAFIILVGTKKDLLSQASLSEVETHVKRVCKELKSEFWAVSSKNGENVREMFFRVACLTFDDNIAKHYNFQNTTVLKEASSLVSFKRKAKQNQNKMKGKCTCN